MLSEVYFTKGFSLEGHRASCTFDYLSRDFNSRFWLCFMIVIGYVIPNFVIFISYICLFRAVKYRRTRSGLFKLKKSDSSKPDVNNDKSLVRDDEKLIKELISSEIKLFKNILSQIGLFNIAWLPYVFLVMIAQFGDIASIHKIVTPFSVLITNYVSKSFVLAINIFYAILNFNSILSEQRANEKKRAAFSNIERPPRFTVSIIPKVRNGISVF